MLLIDELTVSYKSQKNVTKALGPLSMEIDNGEIYAIIGPSGCGKSTLLNVLSGIITCYQGKVLLKGEKLNPKTHDIGFIPQNFGLLPWKNVEQNCLLSLNIKGEIIDGNLKEKIQHVMNKLDIDSLKERYPSELSGGQKQRVAIARALIMNPDLLLMDEPFSALDALTREEAQELFIDIWNLYKVTTIFVTHSIEEAIYMGKKIMIMSHCPGTIVEIIDNPLFNTENLREKEEYLKLSVHIRSIIKKGWKI
ncbi:MAG: ABC transporter ATP-binding protein [Clostridiaceae bacterium]|nr:ABC transporter ATP-binding protein [Clostridiaceae bacterium]